MYPNGRPLEEEEEEILYPMLVLACDLDLLEDEIN
jgi:hypothetical protein